MIILSGLYFLSSGSPMAGHFTQPLRGGKGLVKLHCGLVSTGRDFLSDAPFENIENFLDSAGCKVRHCC